MIAQETFRDEIIKSAQGLFARFGFKKTTIEDIAKSLKKTKGLIYHYFANKEDLIHTILRKEGEAFKKAITAAVTGENDPEKKFQVYVMRRCLELKRLSNFYHISQAEYYTRFQSIIKLRKEFDTFELETIKTILYDGCRKGIFTADNIDLVAFAFITALKGFEQMWMTYADMESMKKDNNKLLDIFFYGIKKR